MVSDTRDQPQAGLQMAPLGAGAQALSEPADLGKLIPNPGARMREHGRAHACMCSR